MTDKSNTRIKEGSVKAIVAYRPSFLGIPYGSFVVKEYTDENGDLEVDYETGEVRFQEPPPKGSFVKFEWLTIDVDKLRELLGRDRNN